MPVRILLKNPWFRPLAALMGVCVLIASFNTLGSPYGTDVLEPQVRFLFWLLVAALAFAQLLVFFHGPVMLLFFRLPSLFRKLSYCYILAAPIALFGTTSALAAELTLLKSMPISPVASGTYLNAVWCLLPSVGLLGMLLLVWQPFRDIRLQFTARLERQSQHNAGEALMLPPPHPELTESVVPQQLWPETPPCWARAQDHYLYLCLGTGNEMIRARMSDLEARFLPPVGVRVHRSWWVRIDAVLSLKKTDRNWQIKAKDGTQIPVSRSRREALTNAIELSQDTASIVE